MEEERLPKGNGKVYKQEERCAEQETVRLPWLSYLHPVGGLSFLRCTWNGALWRGEGEWIMTLCKQTQIHIWMYAHAGSSVHFFGVGFSTWALKDKASPGPQMVSDVLTPLSVKKMPLCVFLLLPGTQLSLGRSWLESIASKTNCLPVRTDMFTVGIVPVTFSWVSQTKFTVLSLHSVEKYVNCISLIKWMKKRQTQGSKRRGKMTVQHTLVI